MRKVSNNSEHNNGEKFSQELRAQPRKSTGYLDKHGHSRADYNDERHHSHHHEPGKNAVRMQLRSIQRLF